MPHFLETLAPWPEADFAAFGEVDLKARTRMQHLVGRFLGRNWVHIPHVTHHDEIDVTELEVRRKAWNAEHPHMRITPVVPIVKALAQTLSVFAQFNVSLDATGAHLVQKKYVHIGVAVEVPQGLLVPVLRDCDQKPLSVLARELTALAQKARTKGLSMQEMEGGSISISSLGHIGGTAFTPIVNAPEVAILGMTKIQLRPVPAADGSIEWREMLPLSLSYDHRVVNGGDAARFVVAIGRAVQALEFA